MDQRGWRWTDAHFCSLPSQPTLYGRTATPQTNVYTHAKVKEPEGSNKLLVASLTGKLVSVEYHRKAEKLKPSTKEIQFTYIPGDAELVSLDVATRTCQQGKGLIIGITFLKQIQTEEGEHSCMQYLNLYSSCQSEGDSSCLESVAQACVTLELDFMPYQLIHTECVTEDGLGKETVFLLSGNDHKVHMYREVHEPPVLRFKEDDLESYFPELSCPASSIQWMDIVYFDKNKRRLTAQGQQNGQVYVSLVDVETIEVLKGWEVVFESPITCVKIFSPDNQVPFPEFLKDMEGKDNSQEKSSSETCLFNLLVMSALEPTAVYRDILSHGLDDALHLPDSCNYDIPLCACVADIDFDGHNEILVGTYGQELLAYKLMQEDDHIPWVPNKSPLLKSKTSSTVPSNIVVPSGTPEEQGHSKRHRHLTTSSKTSKDPLLDTQIPRKVRSQENLSSSLPRSSDTLHECATVDSTIVTGSSDSKLCYKLLWQRSFASPVVGVDRVDIMGDGMDDLVVVTLRGVHVIQPGLNEVAQVCLKRLKDLVASRDGQTDEQIHMKIDTNLMPDCSVVDKVV